MAQFWARRFTELPHWRLQPNKNVDTPFSEECGYLPSNCRPDLEDLLPYWQSSVDVAPCSGAGAMTLSSMHD